MKIPINKIIQIGTMIHRNKDKLFPLLEFGQDIVKERKKTMDITAEMFKKWNWMNLSLSSLPQSYLIAKQNYITKQVESAPKELEKGQQVSSSANPQQSFLDKAATIINANAQYLPPDMIENLKNNPSQITSEVLKTIQEIGDNAREGLKPPSIVENRNNQLASFQNFNNNK